MFWIRHFNFVACCETWMEESLQAEKSRPFRVAEEKSEPVKSEVLRARCLHWQALKKDSVKSQESKEHCSSLAAEKFESLRLQPRRETCKNLQSLKLAPTPFESIHSQRRNRLSEKFLFETSQVSNSTSMKDAFSHRACPNVQFSNTTWEKESPDKSASPKQT